MRIVAQTCPREAVSTQGQTHVIVAYVKLPIDNFALPDLNISEQGLDLHCFRI
jgi:hypothetical protein